MPFIRGIDDQGKIHWLTVDQNWDSYLNAHNFTPANAEANHQMIKRRNLYLEPCDIIVSEIVELKS